MPKGNRARTTAIRQLMAETGLSYSQASRRICASVQDGTGSKAELRVVQFVLTVFVPTRVDRHSLAQQLADQWHLLSRLTTGETYPAAADVFVPAGLPELQDSDFEAPTLLVHAWAERPWQQDREGRNVFLDFYEAGKACLLQHYSAAGGKQAPAISPVSEQQSRALLSVSDFVARTSGEVPPHWIERMTNHQATAAEAVGRVVLPTGIVRSL